MFAPLDAAYARGGPRHAAMILDANTGAVLHNDDGDELRHPASLTKMMTLYLTFETLESGRLSMTDMVKVSQEAASAAPSNLDLEPGEEITVANAIRALITKSANDVAVALAEKIGGSQGNFARLMNARARDLGMMKTNFKNASGLPNPDQVTTARDMITLGLRLQDDFPTYYPLFATRAFSYQGSTYRNHNTLMNHFAGIDGIKTGYTRASGFNLVSSVRRNGRHVVGAVFGGRSAGSRNGEMRSLLTRALTRASTVKTRKPAPALIAKLKSAPKLAVRPEPKPEPRLAAATIKPSAPAQAPDPVAAVAPAPAADPVAEKIMAAVPEIAAAPLEVFKVKRVMVAPRQGPKRPAPSADETTDMAVGESDADQSGPMAAAPPETASVVPLQTELPAELAVDLPAGLPIVAAPSATPADAIAESFAAPGPAADDAAETVIAKLPAAEPAARNAATYDAPMALLGSQDTPPPAKPLAVAVAKQKPVVKPQAVTFASAPVQRGLPPSSLQAQAANLGAGQAPAPARVASLQPSSTGAITPVAGRYEIQIGAYSSIDDAQRALTSAQNRAGRLLAGYGSVTHPVQKQGRQVFRARFSGFDAQRAASTCTELRRQAVDCFVMTAE